MNRIETRLKQLKNSGRKALSPYITAGDPVLHCTVPIMHALVEGGADILEIGIPFSDPMAEGLVIQQAMERALEQHVSADSIFDCVEAFRQKDSTTPIVLMGYLNTVEYYGYEAFARRAQQAGVDGTILVDLPPEESHEIKKIWETHDLYGIYLCSPTTSEERMQLLNQYARGYLYYISLKGVTGSDEIDIKQVKKIYQQRKSQTALPLMVGFGIKTPAMAADLAGFADGIIVGAALISAIFKSWQAGEDICTTARNLMSGMRHAIDNR